MSDILTINGFLKLEREHRKNNKWWSGRYLVRNYQSDVVQVTIKSFRMHNQILRFNDDPVNYCSGHTIEAPRKMQNFLRDEINRQEAFAPIGG